MIFHVSGCLLAHGEKGLISDTFRHTKWEYSFSVRPIGCTPAFYFAKLFSSSLKYVISVRPDFLNTVSQSVPLMAKLAASFELQHIRKPFI